MMNCGIYSITNTATGQLYIGRAVKVRERLLQHVGQLRRGIHHSKPMQADYDRLGAEAFDAKLLLVCSRADLPMYEAICIVGLKATYNNMEVVGGSFTHSAESRAAIGRGVSARPNQRAPKSEETKRKISESLRGRPSPKRGTTMSVEQRAKLSAAKIGNKNALGHKLGDGTKAQIASALSKTLSDPEVRAAMAERSRGKKQSAETIEKRMQKIRGRKRSPEAIAKFIEANSGEKHWRRRSKSAPTTSGKE